MNELKTALYEQHTALGAKIVDFAGWQMPIQYEGLKAEVEAVRNRVGVFDVSHMGEFFVIGPDAISFVDYLVTNDIAKAEMGKAIYSPLCREDGTIIDDLIVYKLTAENIMICVNAANIDKDFYWMQQHLKGFNCQLLNKSDDYSLLAVQGPKAFEALTSIDLGVTLKNISYYSIQRAMVDDGDILFARTGYTGEDGFEIFGSHAYIKNLWDKLMSAKFTPCGLGARDVLRLEVCYPLYGHELNDSVTPLESGLKWTVKNQKNRFIGKSALETSTPKYQLIKLTLPKGIPRDHYPVENHQGKKIGEITSGTMSVVLKQGIALARVDKSLYNPEDQIFVEIRGKKYPAHINKKPFVSGGHK